MIENKTSAKNKRGNRGWASVCHLADESGYALPSVLFLVVLISNIGLSLISYLFLQRQLVLSEIHQVQAEYAAESGLNTVLGAAEQVPSTGTKREFAFEDGSQSSVEVRPWGGLLYAVSNGYSHKRMAERVAIVAEIPSKDFDHALKFCNPQHALVLTGTTSIKGNVIVGKAGVSTGSLRDYPTPKMVPIEGKVVKEESPTLTPFKKDLLLEQVRFFNELLVKKIRSRENLPELGVVTVSSGRVDLSSVEASTEYIFVEVKASVSGSINRRGPPLYVASSGTLSFDPGTAVGGLVAFLAAGPIILPESIQLQNIVVYSQSSIQLERNATFSGQLIAPVINVQPEASLEYPSFLISTHATGLPEQEQHITLSEKSRVEGSVILLSSGNSTKREERVRIDKGATLVGTVYADGPVTLDGRVVGSVIASDFYFYEAPTQYLGWLRTAQVDRSLLPSGILLPVGFSEKAKLEVLEWL